MKYTKTWISIDDQVKLLTASKELDCDNVDALKRALETVGYYRLSAYWYPYKIGDEAESWRAELEKLLEEFQDIDPGRVGVPKGWRDTIPWLRSK